MIVSLESDKSTPPANVMNTDYLNPSDEAAHQIRMLGTQPEDPSSILRIHMVERQKLSPKFVF